MTWRICYIGNEITGQRAQDIFLKARIKKRRRSGLRGVFGVCAVRKKKSQMYRYHKEKYRR